MAFLREFAPAASAGTYTSHVLPVGYDKSRKEVIVEQPELQLEVIKNADVVIVLDSSIHSGSTMLAVVKKLESLGANRIITYSLIVKQTSRFIPHYFGLLVGEHERIYFLLPQIPNNRLFKPKLFPVGIFRTITEEDSASNSEPLATSVESISKITWDDLRYQKAAHGHDVYVIEVKGKLAAYISLKFDEDKLLIDVIAADKTYGHQGFGGALMRWAENLARSKCCSSLHLWAISNQVAWYKGIGFEPTGQKLDFGAEVYHRMARALLYNFDLKALLQ